MPLENTCRFYSERSFGVRYATNFGLLEDNAGTLWISTQGSLVHFDPEREVFRTYGPGRGACSPRGST